MSTYDDWKTASPFDGDDCGHARPCPPCPIRDRGSAHPACWCDHDREDEEPAPDSRCTWILTTGERCTAPATNGDVCCPCEDARDKRRD